jgi:hypothetical protein
MAIHIIPINDLRNHQEETTCECNPKVDFVDGEMMIIHKSYDEREAFERFEERIMQQEIGAIDNEEFEDLP